MTCKALNSKHGGHPKLGCDEFIKTYFRDCEKILKHIKFVNIDKQFLYVGIRLDDIRDKGFEFSEEDLFILLYP